MFIESTVIFNSFFIISNVAGSGIERWTQWCVRKKSFFSSISIYTSKLNDKLINFIFNAPLTSKSGRFCSHRMMWSSKRFLWFVLNGEIKKSIKSSVRSCEWIGGGKKHTIHPYNKHSFHEWIYWLITISY